MSEKNLSKLEQALRIAAQEIPVFPCIAGGKLPAIEGSFHKATTDAASIKAWWSEWPEANPAYSPEAAGWLVVDLDVKQDGMATWAQLCEKHGWTSDTWTVETPSGGRHLYFAGSGPSTARKLGPGVDTRGVGGYVLAPGAVVDGKPYRVINRAEIADAPQSLLDMVATNAEPREAPPNVKIDEPGNIDRARLYLRDVVVAHEGQPGPKDMRQGSDLRAFQLGCVLRDHALSPEVAADLLHKIWAPHFERSWLEVKVANAYAYGQNEPGADYREPGAETWSRLHEEAKSEQPREDQQEQQHDDGLPPMSDADKARFLELSRRMRGNEPDEDENLPEIEYWNDEKTLPKTVDGSCIEISGPYGHLKSALAMSICMKAVKERGVRVAWVVGEGVHGVRKNRVPAVAKALGMTTRELRGRWRTVPVIPNLSDPMQVDALIHSLRGFRPDIIPIDTVATATPGIDENSKAFGDIATSNGAIGQIKRAFPGALVILIHHTGKDIGRGSRGHTSLPANSDGHLIITMDHETRLLECFVEKMRDGDDHYHLTYKATPKGQVPVLTFLRKGKPDAAEPADADSKGKWTSEVVYKAITHCLAVGDFYEPNDILTEPLCHLVHHHLDPDVPDLIGVKLDDEQQEDRKALRKQLNKMTSGRAQHLVRKKGGKKNAPWHWSIPVEARQS